jgi:hypothetical protein
VDAAGLQGSGTSPGRTYSLWVDGGGSVFLDSSDATGRQTFSTAAGVITFGQWTELTSGN